MSSHYVSHAGVRNAIKLLKAHIGDHGALVLLPGLCRLARDWEELCALRQELLDAGATLATVDVVGTYARYAMCMHRCSSNTIHGQDICRRDAVLRVADRQEQGSAALRYDTGGPSS